MRGAGPVAVMRLLQSAEGYGYELIELLERNTAGVLAMGQSTLYPLLYNLEAKGWITSRTEIAENGRSRKYYRLTDKGKKRLAQDCQQWQVLTAAMGKLGVLGA
jgi:PadR family transcriptional regulator PadR